MRVSIVNSTFNNVELTRQCVEAIERTTADRLAEVIVVDNASTDDTLAFLAEAEPARRLRAVLNATNRGFSAACNQGAAVARGEFVLFLNNDTVPHDGWLDALLAAADADRQIGVLGSKLLYADGTVQHAGVVVGERDGDPHPYHVYLCQPADAPHVSHPRELQMVTGACLTIRRALFEQIGGFDEGYWNGHEDLDLCLKARAAGLKVVYRPDSVVTHLESQTKRLIGLEQFHYDKDADTPEAQDRRRFLERWRDSIEIDDRRVLAEDGFGDGLNVLFTMVGWADDGGGTILPRQIAKALVRRGHRVTVLYAPVEERPDQPPYHLELSVEDGVRLIALYNRPSRFNDPLRHDREFEDVRVEQIYVEDAAAAYLQLAERTHEDGVAGEAWNFSTESPMTALAMTEAITAAVGRPDLEPLVEATARHEIQDQFLSAAKARAVLGWEPLYGLEEGLRRTVDWYGAYLATA